MKKYTYKDIQNLLTNSDKSLHVAIHFGGERVEWMPVDKTLFLPCLDVMHPEKVIYPHYFEIESDGEMFIHPLKKPLDVC